MDEAAKTERKNAKSLNRWEEAEKKRSEEQKAKLEALHNRQLTGPVISFWSGIARWINGKVFQTGVREIREAGHKEQSTLVIKGQPELQANVSLGKTQNEANVESSLPSQRNEMTTTELPAPSGNPQMDASQNSPQGPTQEGPPGLLDGLHAYAALPVDVKQPEFTGTADDGFQNLPPPIPPAAAKSPPGPLPDMLTPRKPIAITDEYTSRSLIALRNIDVNAIRVSELRDHVLLKKQKTKLQKPVPVSCAITSQPAKFRDPRTGLAYANTYAYKEIQRLHSGGSRWSNLLDCYVGSANVVARGVPDRFSKRP